MHELLETIANYPYLGVVLIFLLCGLGLPLPEEIVLVFSGYVCAKWPERADLAWMMFWCGTGILSGDLLPYLLGRIFGARILRLRWMRIMVTRRRLALFDRWFRRRGDLVIFIARFLAGIRSIAFFTAGMMKMRWRRFLLLDGLGIVLIVPLLVWLGFTGAAVIDDVVDRVRAIERGLLVLIGVAAAVAGLWYWLHRRRQQRARDGRMRDTFIEPQSPVMQGLANPHPAEPEAGTANPASPPDPDGDGDQQHSQDAPPEQPPTDRD
jgi:membrane protein DedA with SNARE-associated domain